MRLSDASCERWAATSEGTAFGPAPECRQEENEVDVQDDHQSSFTLLALRLVSPRLSDGDLAALRLVSRQLRDTVSHLATSLHCTAATTLAHPSLFTGVDKLVLDLTPIDLPRPQIAGQATAEGLQTKWLNSQQWLAYLDVLLDAVALFTWCLCALALVLPLTALLVAHWGLALCMVCWRAPRDVRSWSDVGMVVEDCRSLALAGKAREAYNRLREPVKGLGLGGEKLSDRMKQQSRLLLWRLHVWRNLRPWHLRTQRRLLLCLKPVLPQVKHLSLVSTINATYKEPTEPAARLVQLLHPLQPPSHEHEDVVSAVLLWQLLSRFPCLETFTYHCQGGKQLAFQGQGATAAERRTSLLPQLAAMRPFAPLLDPASWAAHNCLTAARCQHPPPRSGPDALSAALATASLRTLHIDLTNGTRWTDAAFTSRLAALCPSVTRLSLSCHVSGFLLQAPHPAQPPYLANLQQLQLQLVTNDTKVLDPNATSQLASAWTHLTHLTHLSIKGLPWGPFIPQWASVLAGGPLLAADLHMANGMSHLRHLEAPELYQMSNWPLPVHVARLRHLAGHLQHLVLGKGWEVGGAVRHLTALTYLELRHMPVTPELCWAVASIPKLATLSLDPCGLTPPPLALSGAFALFAPAFSTLRLAAAHWAACLNTLAVSTLLPGRRVHISIVQGGGPATEPLAGSLGPLEAWCFGWLASALPAGFWAQAACLHSYQAASAVTAGVCAAASQEDSAAERGSSSSTVGSISGSGGSVVSVLKSCCTDIQVQCQLAARRGPLRDRLVVPCASARLRPTPRAFQQALLLAASTRGQQAILTESKLTFLLDCFQPGSTICRFTIDTTGGAMPMVLTPAHLLSLPRCSLPGLVAVTLDDCSQLAADDGGDDGVEPLCVLAAAAPNLRRVRLRQLACDAGSVLHAFECNCRALEEISLELQPEVVGPSMQRAG